MPFRASAIILLLVFVAGSAAAPVPEQGRLEKGPKPSAAPVSATEETEALAFVREHHPELAELLDQLKSGNPKQYNQAMRDLAKSATTLGETQTRDPRRYELDLKAWKVNSRVQVLAARLAMSPDPELEEKLKAELLEQIDVRLEQQELERERLKARLEKLESAIERTRASRETQAERAFAKLKGGMPKKPEAKSPKKPTKSAPKTTP